ncbi:hypothetical protein HPB47_024538 [Ixodes persulcatus]|uniref:Uncharacterized protein n=1 Tax=Ixodes persulcatus TaxID=34615 RepID=A0AC60Q421_IXOPE|nr:hypothetical protein HPB47_024538 [Ixodes persulcatus]
MRVSSNGPEKEEAKGASVHTFNRRSANHQLQRRKRPQIFQQEQQQRVPKGICYPRTPSLWKSDHRLALFGQFLLLTGWRPTNPNEEYGTCGRPAAGAEPSPRHRDPRWITSKWQCTAEAGWLVSHRQRGTRALNKLGLTATSTAKNDAGGRTENRKPRQRHRKQRQQPALPREDIKVILRPREGLDVTKTFEVTAYAAPPEDTARGVIHNIPDYDTAEDITRSLVYKKNPTILQAQRMGKTNSVVIVFEGNKVPYYVYYLGHRMDVCPAPEDKICRSCGTKNPRDGHKCDPKCALCCGDHPTGDKNCKNRFQTPYLLRKRQRDRERLNGASQYGGHRNVESTAAGERKKGGREIVRAPSLVYPTADQETTTTRDSGSSAGQDLNQDAGALTPKADISQDRHPKAADTRLREKPSRTSSAPQDATKKISNQTSAQQADRQQQVELTKIKQMLEMVVAENAKLKAEVAKLRGSENADKVVPETQGPSKSQAPPPDQGKANTIQSTQVPLAEDSSSDEMENSEPESPPPKPMLAKFAESIGTQIAALNARVTAIEAISPRFTGGGGGTGPMKSTKPYARPARAQALDKRFAHLEDVVYVDAADYSSRDAMAISVVDRQGKLINSGTVFTTLSEVGEEAAIALAMTSSSRIKFIVSDSKPAILNYTRGRISSEALKILRTGLHGDRVRGVLIVWAPAHSGLPGNENAHDAARGLTDRADVTNIFDAHSFHRSDRDRLVAYRDVINHYRLGRAKYPAANRTLSKWQAVAWRLLQTNTFPNPVAYSRCYPGLYSSACKHCGHRADLQHMVWACPFKKHRNDRNRAQNLMLNIKTSEQWETMLLSSDPKEQVRLVQMAEAAAKEQELLAAD